MSAAEKGSRRRAPSAPAAAPAAGLLLVLLLAALLLPPRPPVTATGRPRPGAPAAPTSAAPTPHHRRRRRTAAGWSVRPRRQPRRRRRRPSPQGPVDGADRPGGPRRGVRWPRLPADRRAGAAAARGRSGRRRAVRASAPTAARRTLAVTRLPAPRGPSGGSPARAPASTTPRPCCSPTSTRARPSSTSSVLGPDGEVDTVGTRGRPGGPALAQAGRRSPSVAPQTDDLALDVHASRGRVVAAVDDSFGASPPRGPGQEWLAATDRPARPLRLAGVPGTARPAGPCWSPTRPTLEAVVDVGVSGASGTFAPTGLDAGHRRARARSRASTCPGAPERGSRRAPAALAGARRRVAALGRPATTTPTPPRWSRWWGRRPRPSWPGPGPTVQLTAGAGRPGPTSRRTTRGGGGSTAPRCASAPAPTGRLVAAGRGVRRGQRRAAGAACGGRSPTPAAGWRAVPLTSLPLREQRPGCPARAALSAVSRSRRRRSGGRPPRAGGRAARRPARRAPCAPSRTGRRGSSERSSIGRRNSTSRVGSPPVPRTREASGTVSASQSSGTSGVSSTANSTRPSSACQRLSSSCDHGQHHARRRPPWGCGRRARRGEWGPGSRPGPRIPRPRRSRRRPSRRPVGTPRCSTPRA